MSNRFWPATFLTIHVIFVIVCAGNDGFDSGAPPPNQVFRVTYEGDMEISRAATDLQCWKFTWAGPVEGDINNTRSCDVLLANDIPCFEPLVWTEGEDRFNGPNLTQIAEKCAAGETTNGATCDPFCKKEGKSCIQMTYRRRDKTNSIAFQTHFCGEGINVSSGGKIISRGCHKQPNHVTPVGQYDLQSCFCQGDLCNASPVTLASTIKVVLLGVLAARTLS